MKSGTNWLGSLLNSHPHVECAGEFHFHEVIDRILASDLSLKSVDQETYHQSARNAAEDMIRRCMTDAVASHVRVIGDRTPHTVAPLTLRDAKYIVIMRDPRDVLVSRAFHLYNNPTVHRFFNRYPELKLNLRKFQDNPWFFKENPATLLEHEVLVKESVTLWKEHVRTDEQTIQHHPNLQCARVRYEDLHSDTAAQRNNLLKFLGVDPNLATPVEGEIRPGFQQERPHDFFRKGAVGDWKNYFTDPVKNWFKQVAGPELIQFGYAKGLAW
ncbi:MAG: sulfotransferase domain-containing protein [Planctomycetota bacterium]